MFCSKCGKEMNGGTCQTCGPVTSQPTPIISQARKKSNGFLKVILIVVGVFIFIGILVAIFGGSSSSTTTPNSADSANVQEKADLEVLSSSLQSDQFASYITGELKNNTDHEYSYVQLEFNLYDKSGAQVGSALANENNLEAGGIWKFKAMGTGDNVASFKLKDVSGT